MTTREKAIVLLSGGLDSATALAVAQKRGFDAHVLMVDYGQRHRSELMAAEEVATRADLGLDERHRVTVDLYRLGGSALFVDGPAVPKDRPREAMAREIPVTYVPARNTLFLSLALALGESIGAYSLFVGANVIDYSGYPDCRPEFFAAFQKMACLGTKSGVGYAGEHRWKIETPLIGMKKCEIVKLGTRLSVDYSLTLSCYDPMKVPGYWRNDNGTAWQNAENLACGHCDACQIRRDGFREAGVPDPTRYA